MRRRRGPGRGSLSRRLVVALALGAIAVTLVIGLLIGATGALSEAQRATIRSERTLARAARVEKLAVDLETGLRGYALTGQLRFLAPYRTAREEVGDATRELVRAVAADPGQRGDALALERGLADYQREFSEPFLAEGRPAARSGRAIASTTEGRRRLNGIRQLVARLTARERARLSERSQAAERRTRTARVTAGVAVALLLAMVLGLALYLDRLVVAPVRRLGRGVERLRAGDLETRVGGPGPREIAELGRALDEMAATLQARTSELERLGARSLARLDSIFAQTPAGLAFLDREWRYVRVNAALAAMTGHPPEAHVGRLPAELMPDAQTEEPERFERVTTTGEVVAGVAVRGPSPVHGGEPREWSVTAFPVREDDEIVGVGLVVLDVTVERRTEAAREAALVAERAARTRASLLAEASQLLDESLEMEETLASLARLVVPRLADWCTIELAMPGGRVRNAAVAHADPERLPQLRAYRERYPPDANADVGAAAVIRSGRAELFPRFDDGLRATMTLDAEHADRVAALGIRSVMVVPLIARGGTLGAISLVSSDSGRTFDADDFATAQDLGARAALALDNARLYRERADIAKTLQSSLLPAQLPEIPGVSIAARYEPVGAAADVGGDFYDVFAVAPDRWAVVVGDVCGKGAEAAALTALARYTLRAVAPAPPEEALRRLNAAILRQRDDLRFITLVYAELDLSGARPRLSLSSGGHPPPIVFPAEGLGRVVECRGTLIGVTAEPRLTTCSVELAAGDTVALYTDGVTEASHADPLDGDSLIALLDGAERSAAGVADGLQRLARAPGEDPRDDVAIVALQV